MSGEQNLRDTVEEQYLAELDFLRDDYIQVDETTLPVIDHDRHKVAKECIWIVRAAVPRLLFFHYDNGLRPQKVAVDFLKTFKGYLRVTATPLMTLLRTGRTCACADV